MTAAQICLVSMILGCWLLALPARLRRWWTNESGAVLIVAGLIMLILAVQGP